MVMHRCSHSITTITPRGSRIRCSASATWVVSRSCTCGRLAYRSTSRASLLRPVIRPSAVRDVADVGDPGERHQVVLAAAPHLDVLDQHELVVAQVEHRGQHVLRLLPRARRTSPRTPARPAPGCPAARRGRGPRRCRPGSPGRRRPPGGGRTPPACSAAAPATASVRHAVGGTATSCPVRRVTGSRARPAASSGRPVLSPGAVGRTAHRSRPDPAASGPVAPVPGPGCPAAGWTPGAAGRRGGVPGGTGAPPAGCSPDRECLPPDRRPTLTVARWPFCPFVTEGGGGVTGGMARRHPAVRAGPGRPLRPQLAAAGTPPPPPRGPASPSRTAPGPGRRARRGSR